MTTLLSTRRNSRPLSRCRRWDLAQGVPPPVALPGGFLRALKRYDSALELYWHPVRHRWILYRVVRRGVVPSEDTLAKEWEIVGKGGCYREPGLWLLDWMRKSDMTRNGEIHPEYALKQALISDDLHEKHRVEAQEARFGEMSHAYARDVLRYGKEFPTSHSMPKGMTAILKNKGASDETSSVRRFSTRLARRRHGLRTDRP